MQNRSDIFAIVTALVCIVGILYFHWSLAAIMLIFWLESVCNGIMHVVWMSLTKSTGKFSHTIVFCGHYIAFLIAYLVFILFFIPANVGDIIPAILGWVPILVVYVYKSYVEFDKYNATSDLMFAPYKRTLVMHIVLVASGYFAVTQDSPVGMVLLLVVIKLAFDLFNKPAKKMTLL